MEHMAKGK